MSSVGLGVNIVTSSRGPGSLPNSVSGGALNLTGSLTSLSPMSSLTQQQPQQQQQQQPGSGNAQQQMQKSASAGLPQTGTPSTSPSSGSSTKSGGVMGGGGVLCRKFAPNIFNKSKCQNCFRLREAHSADALETSRATRIVVKCGYLFLAPEWDFTSQSSRTKRWQRRWFVLYDDGELTYALDEQPDTLPCAAIDMRHALDVALADELTGNAFSIALTHADRIHFVKATCREDARRWYEVLCRASPNNLRSSTKRNQTLPGSLPSAQRPATAGAGGASPCQRPGGDRMLGDEESEALRDINRETPTRQRFHSVSGSRSGMRSCDRTREETESRQQHTQQQSQQPQQSSRTVEASPLSSNGKAGDFLSTSPSMVVYQVVNSLLSKNSNSSGAASNGTNGSASGGSSGSPLKQQTGSSAAPNNVASGGTNNNNNNNTACVSNMFGSSVHGNVNVISVNMSSNSSNFINSSNPVSKPLHSQQLKTSAIIKSSNSENNENDNSNNNNNSNNKNDFLAGRTIIYDTSTATGNSGVSSLDDCEVLKKRRFLKRETKALKSQRSRSDGVAKMLPSAHLEDPAPQAAASAQWSIVTTVGSQLNAHAGSDWITVPSLDTPNEHSQLSANLSVSNSAPNFNNTGKRCGTNANTSPVYFLLSESGSRGSSSQHAKSLHNTTSSSVLPAKTQLRSSHQQPSSVSSSSSSLVSDHRRVKVFARSASFSNQAHQRGVPDGCPLSLDEDMFDAGVDTGSHGTLSASSTLNPGSTPLISSLRSLNTHSDAHQFTGSVAANVNSMKKGWLHLRQRYNGQVEWTRMWFVLRQHLLAQFDDPQSEEKGIAHASLDTRTLRAATELDNAERNYAFALVWTPVGTEGLSRELVLSAATAAIRTGWLHAIRQSAASANSLAFGLASASAEGSSTSGVHSSQGSSSTHSISSGVHGAPALSPGLAAPVLSSSTVGSSGFAMLSGHSDSSSRQLRRQPSPSRTSASTLSGLAHPSAVELLQQTPPKDGTLQVGSEKGTSAKSKCARTGGSGSGASGFSASPGDSGGEASYFSATDSTPILDTSISVASRHGRGDLPPSPIPNRNALSKAKHRARSTSAHSRNRYGNAGIQSAAEVNDTELINATNSSTFDHKRQIGISTEADDDESESSCEAEDEDNDDLDLDGSLAELTNRKCSQMRQKILGTKRDCVDGMKCSPSIDSSSLLKQEAQKKIGSLSFGHNRSGSYSHHHRSPLLQKTGGGGPIHEFAREQALDNKYRLACRELETKQAEIDALRRTAGISSMLPANRLLLSGTSTRISMLRSPSPSRCSFGEEVDDASRRAHDLISKSLQLLKHISTKTALKEVKEKCLDLQSHIVSLETLISDLLEILTSVTPTTKGPDLSESGNRSMCHAGVQVTAIASSEGDERLSKAQREISRLSKELLAAQKATDDAELQLIRVSNEMKMAGEEHRQQTTLLHLRIDDLTAKLSNSEKNAKLATQKLARLEKRRLSLKGKESVNISKDLETKLSNLEAKVLFLEDMSTMTDSQSDVSEDMRSQGASTSKQTINRRLSTDSQNSENNTCVHRIYQLDQKVKSAVEAAGGMPIKAKLYLQSRAPAGSGVVNQHKLEDSATEAAFAIEEWRTVGSGSVGNGGAHHGGAVTGTAATTAIGAAGTAPTSGVAGTNVVISSGGGTASLSASLTDLTDLAGLEPSSSASSSMAMASVSMSPHECLDMLSQRVDSLLCWFTGCLQALRRGAAAEDAPWCRLLGQLVELIDHLSRACDRVPGSATMLYHHHSPADGHRVVGAAGSGSSDKASLGLAYNLLLLQETARAVRMVNDTDRDLRHSLHGSARQMFRVLASFNASLSQNCFTADAIFEGLQQGLRASEALEASSSVSLAENFVPAAMTSTTSLGDTVDQVKTQFDCAAHKVAEYKRGKRAAIQDALSRLLANHSPALRIYGSSNADNRSSSVSNSTQSHSNALNSFNVAGDHGDNAKGGEVAWNACACVARQEALLSRVTEAIARVSTSVGFYLDKSLGQGSTLLLNFDKMPEPGQMKALVADALQTEIDLLNYELRKDCIEILDMSVYGGSSIPEMPNSYGSASGLAFVDDSVMTAMETEILPEVNEIVTLICVFAIFKGYLAYLEQQSSSTSCLAETFRRISSPSTVDQEAANGRTGAVLPPNNSPSIASSTQVLESVHSKFFEMLLMLNGTNDVPQAVERWLACVINSSSSHGGSPGEQHLRSTSPSGGTPFGHASEGAAGPASDASLLLAEHPTQQQASTHHASSVVGGDCALIIPSLTATVTSAIGRVQAKLAREQHAQKDALNSLRQRLEQVERERNLNNNGVRLECEGCESLQRKLDAQAAARESSSCSSCRLLEEKLKNSAATRCSECPAVLRRLEEYEAALAAGCPGCDRLEKDLEDAIEVQHHITEVTQKEKQGCKRCSELQEALDAARSSYDVRITALQSDFEVRLKEQLRIGEEIQINRLPRWQNELDQVRQLCDKGIILLRESHASEVARLRVMFESQLNTERAERERLLAEESRATQIALEALQREHRTHIEELKAHIGTHDNLPGTDVKKNALSSDPVNQNKVLDEIRQDIVSLSEKFSKKCVEAAAIQERLYATQKQLQKANTQLFDLLATRARSEPQPGRLSTSALTHGAVLVPSAGQQAGSTTASSTPKHSALTRR